MSALALAAAALQVALRAEWPEHAWLVDVREGQRVDTGGLPTASQRQPEVEVTRQDAHSSGDGGTPTPSGPSHHNRAQQAA